MRWRTCAAVIQNQFMQTCCFNDTSQGLQSHTNKMRTGLQSLVDRANHAQSAWQWRRSWPIQQRALLCGTIVEHFPLHIRLI